VLGDFNRRLNQPGDRVWADLDDGDPANADLTALTQEMPVSCRDNEFTDRGYAALLKRSNAGSATERPWKLRCCLSL
jgi:hypothetical protein